MASDKDAKTKSRWGRSIILEEIGFQYFPHTQRMLDKKFCLIEIWKFLEFTQGSLQERSSLPLTPHSRIASPHLLPPIVPWRLALRQHLLTRGCRTHRMMSRIASSALSSIPKPRSKEIPVSRQSLHSSPHSSRLPMSRPQTWFMKLALPGEQMRQSAWRRSPGSRSFLSQVPVGWWQGGWSSPSQSRLLTLHFDVRSEEVVAEVGVEGWGLWQGERDSFPRCLDELKTIFCESLLSWRPVEGTSALNRDRFLPRPSAPKPARVLSKINMMIHCDLGWSDKSDEEENKMWRKWWRS